MGLTRVQLHFNDLSIRGQFEDPRLFCEAIRPILEFRARYPRLSQRLFCSRGLSQRLATPRHTVQQAVLASHDRNFISLILRWLGAGPFWDDDRAKNPEDYFHYEGEDVTLQGLGEAARRILLLIDAGSFSLSDGTARFALTPLNVNHGLEEEPLGVVPVPGFWTVTELSAVLTQAPDSWAKLIDEATARFHLVWFHPDILLPLAKVPFDAAVAERVITLLAVLQSLAAETNADGSLNAHGLEIWQKHSVGEMAWFTDESDQNKIDFKNSLEFRDPEYGGKFNAAWHGKVKRWQFRIHFEWPRPANQVRIRIAYIGPKLTKH